MQQKPFGSQSLEHLLSVPLQTRFTGPWSKGKRIFLPRRLHHGALQWSGKALWETKVWERALRSRQVMERQRKRKKKIS